MLEVYPQSLMDATIIVSLSLITGAPDTGATLTVKAITPDGTEHTTFTAPTITEPIAGSGVYKLVFPTAAATLLFDGTPTNWDLPYTILVASATSGSTFYRAYSVLCLGITTGFAINDLLNDMVVNQKYRDNKKALVKDTGVWKLIFYDDDNTTPIFTKILKDSAGNDIDDIPAGILAQELKGS